MEAISLSAEGRRQGFAATSARRFVGAFLGSVCGLALSGVPISALASAAPKVRVRIVDGVQSFSLRGFDLRFRATGAKLSPVLGNRAPAASAPLATLGTTPTTPAWGGKYGGLQGLRLQQSSALSLGISPTAASAPALRAASRQLATRVDQLSDWKISCPNGGVVHAEQIPQGKSRAKNVYFPGPVSIESPSGFITVRGKSYREKIAVHPIQTRKGWECEVVNHVDLESYLDGLVNGEFSAAWSQEAIDAQVVAARTYAYYQMKAAAAKKGGTHFDLDSDVKDQVYDGSGREDYRSRRSANRTRGLVLKSSKGDAWPIKAYYHSTCGGTTELPEVVWGSSAKGFKKRVPCTHCRNSPSFIWDVPLRSREIADILWKGAQDLSATERDLTRNWPVSWERELRTSRLLELRVTEQNASGRAEKVSSRWSNAEGKEYRLDLPGTLFRLWIGPSRLKSTVFQVLAAGSDQWVLRGRGFGHGVGLCQWGAKTMGEAGKKSKDILKFYYPDAVLARVW
jgi:stage II sporulation protein D